MEEWLVIGISGVTNSGKSTLADMLHKSLLSSRRQEVKAGFILNNVHLIKQDEYFRPKDDKNHVKIEEINHINWEIIGALDMDKMLKDIFEILNSRFILHQTKSVTNHFQSDNIFWDHYRSHLTEDKLNNHGILNKIVKSNVLLNILIIEGFLVFNHAILLDLCNLKFHLHVPYEVCYERRQKRMYDPPDVPLYFEMAVWPSYEQHLKEIHNRDEIIFLNGETPPEKSHEYVKQRIWSDLS